MEEKINTFNNIRNKEFYFGPSGYGFQLTFFFHNCPLIFFLCSKHTITFQPEKRKSEKSRSYLGKNAIHSLRR